MNINHKLFINTGFSWEGYHYLIPVEANSQNVYTMFSNQVMTINVKKVDIVLFKTEHFWHKAIDIPTFQNINKL